jgi:ABC-type phosphate transport system substrate-binding protein
MHASSPLTAERGRIRAAVVALCAVASLAVAVAITPTSAHAAFTIGHCEGAPIGGQGSSAQKEAQLEFWSTTIFHSGSGCGGSAPHVEYEANGSGCGIASIGGAASTANCLGFTAAESKPGFRAPGTRFAGSDAPLTVNQQIAADAAGGEKPGLIHQIPVASFAVAIIVHFPNGCSLKNPGPPPGKNGVGSLNGDTSTGGPNDPPTGETGDTAAEETLRVHISAEEMETIWDGTSQTWGDIVPQEDFGNALLTEREGCANTPVIRIVRFDGSGTTFNFKAYLSLLPGAPTGLWTTAPVAGDNNVWPETFNNTKTTPNPVNGSHECTESDHICTGEKNGGGEVTSAVEKTNGSIGYADLATSRKHGFYMETGKKNDHTYWIPMQTISPEEGDKVGPVYAEPSVVPTSNLVASPEGANCEDADYRNYPTGETDPTLGDWETSIATGSTKTAIEHEPIHAYPVCGLTYDFAWDDDAPVYGEGGEEQARARTVKDYLEAVESVNGQHQLVQHDYGTLPENIIQIARTGVAAIDWNKSVGSGKGSEEEVHPPAIKPPTVTTTTQTVVTPPSNAFSVAGAKIKGKSVVLSLVLPGAGKVQIKAVGGGVTFSNVTASVGGGQGTVTLPISGAAVKKLAKVKDHKLSVKITVTFTPTGGAAASKAKTITITQAAIATKKKKKGKKKG